jgi:hypothetical protein
MSDKQSHNAWESCLEFSFCSKPRPSACHYTGTRKVYRKSVSHKSGNLPTLN